ncbi:MAG: ion transporter, partial [Candidatus Latescibacterota bacterium]
MIQSVQAIVQSKLFQNSILFLIILAAVIVGIETDRNIDPASLEILHILDDLILYLFTLEAALKILAEGKRPWRYFQSGWNLF